MDQNSLSLFNKIRKQARAYLCYLFQRHIPNYLPEISIDTLAFNLEKIIKEIPQINAAYILNKEGIQVIDNITNIEKYKVGKNVNRSDKGFFYRAVKEKKCILTDPYPSALEGTLIVSAAMPIYNDKHELLYVVVIDISLNYLLKIVDNLSDIRYFSLFSKTVYTFFALALFSIAVILFANGINSFFHIDSIFGDNAKKMFQSTILLTLALAIFDLVKTIFEQEVLGKQDQNHPSQIHKTMVKFLGSIIIALAIESLMLVFKFALSAPEQLIYASYLIGSVTFLILGLAYYIKSVSQADFVEEKCER